MKKTALSIKVFATLGALTLGAMSAPSPASAVSFNQWVSVFRNNTAGTTGVNLSPVATSFCYLGRMTVQETDTNAETAACDVLMAGAVWRLEARLGASLDADVECLAVCYNN